MMFHAPQSRTRIASLIMRRTLFNRATFVAIGAAVTTSVVLAGRGPDIGGSTGEYPALSTSSIALAHLALPAGSLNETQITSAILPDPLTTPVSEDATIAASLYETNVDLPQRDVAMIEAPDAIADSVIDDFSALGTAAPTKPTAPRAIRLASLTTPEGDWDVLDSISDPKFPTLARIPTSPDLPSLPEMKDVDAIDILPESNPPTGGPVIETLEARSGEILSQMLARANMTDADRRATLVALRADDISDSLFEGDQIDVALMSPSDNQLLAIRLRQVGKPPIELRWDGDSDPLWESLDSNIASAPPAEAIVETPPKEKTLSITGKQDDTIFVSGVISSSLYAAAGKAGLTAGETKALTDIFRYSVDFGRDLRKGDHFEALFEKGENGSYGDILYAKLTNRGSEIALYRGTENETGATGYFDAAGKTNKRTLMRTPLADAQVSSHFGMRLHPVLGYTKMHRGTDFRARTGTPIFAAGDGIVDFLGRKGAYGKYIRIRHNSTFETAYAHLSKYAANLKNGDRVRQGEVIGYVGSTGRSTGPHLHFEILQHGNQINPLKVADFGPVKGLEGSALSRFMVRVSRIEIALTRLRRDTRVATAE